MDEPGVIVDFIFEEGLLFVSLENIGAFPAFDVRVEFSESIQGVGGAQVSTLPIFRRLSFLAPHKRIVAFVDTTASYFHRKQPLDVTASISWADADGTRRSADIHHDLSVYRDLSFIAGRPRS